MYRKEIRKGDWIYKLKLWDRCEVVQVEGDIFSIAKECCAGTFDVRRADLQEFWARWIPKPPREPFKHGPPPPFPVWLHKDAHLLWYREIGSPVNGFRTEEVRVRVSQVNHRTRMFSTFNLTPEPPQLWFWDISALLRKDIVPLELPNRFNRIEDVV